MFEEVYPSNLRDAFPPPHPDYEGVKAWFSRNAKVGSSTAGAMASLYLVVAEGDISGESRTAAKTKPTSRNAQPLRAASRAPKAPKRTEERERVDAKRSGGSSGDFELPAVHIDVQIHIAADASAEQIDALFESMAKHLYQRS